MPAMNKTMRAAQQPASVGIIPILKRKIATAAAMDRPSANRSNARKPRRITAEQKIAHRNGFVKHRVNRKPDGKVEHDADDGRLYRRRCAVHRPVVRNISTNGAPRKIQRKQGVKVTDDVSNPPRVPASRVTTSRGRNTPR
jgi:hypothetical protein